MRERLPHRLGIKKSSRLPSAVFILMYVITVLPQEREPESKDMLEQKPKNDIFCPDSL